jgi:N-acetylglucosaminyl-diphospho-decaprenol L-rhamnosyltransferase
VTTIEKERARENNTGEPAQTSVDVVVVNWNTSSEAVQAARGYASSDAVKTRVFVFDNDSLPEQVEILRSASGNDFELIESDRNIGFGAAANRALEKGQGRYVVVSNADVAPDPDALWRMGRVADENPDAGMVGPVFVDGGNNYHDHIPGPLTLLIRTLVGGFGRVAIDLPGVNEVARVGQPSGACFLMSRDVWADVGGFDDSFFLWYEDVDLARRLQDRGMTGFVVGGARVQHIGGESFALLSNADKQRIRLESLGHYLALHHPRARVLARPLLWLSSVLRVGRASEKNA